MMIYVFDDSEAGRTAVVHATDLDEAWRKFLDRYYSVSVEADGIGSVRADLEQSVFVHDRVDNII